MGVGAVARLVCVLVVLLAAVGLWSVVSDARRWDQCYDLCAPRHARLSGTYACYCQGGHAGGWEMRPDTDTRRWKD